MALRYVAWRCRALQLLALCRRPGSRLPGVLVVGFRARRGAERGAERGEARSEELSEELSEEEGGKDARARAGGHGPPTTTQPPTTSPHGGRDSAPYITIPQARTASPERARENNLQKILLYASL